ncbi:hypothetical protein RRG08_056610 [Elysia crispata]|uniref:Uncharacterized protein n=1 Tax=Elysia crispata TaxID=231223 RepID=A0AAE1DBY1_9GAST|nr:hypothetical protein RRG08_056610 [Elysia crispata]
MPVGACGCLWVPLDVWKLSGCLWVPLDACGYLWAPVGASGCLWVPLDACVCLTSRSYYSDGRHAGYRLYLVPLGRSLLCHVSKELRSRIRLTRLCSILRLPVPERVPVVGTLSKVPSHVSPDSHNQVTPASGRRHTTRRSPQR